jgi:hypothetical protein
MIGAKSKDLRLQQGYLPQIVIRWSKKVPGHQQYIESWQVRQSRSEASDIRQLAQPMAFASHQAVQLKKER